jgi:hypothetical protein
MFEKLRDKLGRRPTAGESDVAGDDHLAESRATGSDTGATGDAASTTGTGASGEFVGRISGQDDGAERISGAEARAFGADDNALAADEPSTGRPAAARTDTRSSPQRLHPS